MESMLQIMEHTNRICDLEDSLVRYFNPPSEATMTHMRQKLKMLYAQGIFLIDDLLCDISDYNDNLVEEIADIMLQNPNEFPSVTMYGENDSYADIKASLTLDLFQMYEALYDYDVVTSFEECPPSVLNFILQEQSYTEVSDHPDVYWYPSNVPLRRYGINDAQNILFHNMVVKWTSDDLRIEIPLYVRCDKESIARIGGMSA